METNGHGSPPTSAGSMSRTMSFCLLLAGLTGCAWTYAMLFGESIYRGVGDHADESVPRYATILTGVVTIGLFAAAAILWSKKFANAGVIGLWALALAAAGYIFGIAVCFLAH